ncbi:MAG: amidohydrolase family protein [Actinobacteria bacterium]|uniref:Unannotated protein n=1 Tax=freshwater metagenome TaxID=449393 RepID=A0A6J7KSQ5_9ZZZZ|nr:amidohydrolase family protein [Actinomycetota bacterium]
MMMMADLVIRNAAAVVTDWTQPPILNAWLAVSDGRIEGAGTGMAPSARETIEARNCLIAPGFVAAHHHLSQGASRGLQAPDGLLGWLEVHYRAWARMTPEDVRGAASASLAQLALGGCTTVAGFEYLHPVDEDFVTPVVEAAEQIGLRLTYVRGCAPRLEGRLAEVLAATGTDLRRLLEPEDLAIARTRETLARPSTETLRWACGPTTPVLDDDGAFHSRLSELADEFQVGMHTHFHPLPGSLAEGETAFDLARRVGLVRPGNWFAHGSALTTRDVHELGRAGVGVVHNPSCSILLGYPVPPLAQWCAGNDRVSVSVDGAASNDRAGMLGEAQLTWQLQRAMQDAGGPGMLPSQALELATAAGARTLGWQDVGTLADGHFADLAVWDLGTLEFAGIPSRALRDPAWLLFRTFSGSRARDVLVGGRRVVSNGVLTGAHEGEVAEEVNRIAERLYG